MDHTLNVFGHSLTAVTYQWYELQKYLADILSVLALTMSAEGERVCDFFLKLH